MDEFSQTFHDPNRKVFVKRFGLGKGLGIEVVPVKELQKKLPEIRKAGSAVVQNKVAVERAFRAILVDNPQNGTVVEHYFEAHIPTVTGDGARTVRDLLLESPDIPETAKKKLLKELGSTLNTVPGRNLTINLGDVGHDTHGGYYSTPNDETVRNVRAFASNLKADLEKKVGHAIPVFCIDLAALDKQVLKEDFNLDEAKKRFVAFEFQMGFDPGFDKRSTYLPFIAMLPMVRYKQDAPEKTQRFRRQPKQTPPSELQRQSEPTAQQITQELAERLSEKGYNPSRLYETLQRQQGVATNDPEVFDYLSAYSQLDLPEKNPVPVATIEFSSHSTSQDIASSIYRQVLGTPPTVPLTDPYMDLRNDLSEKKYNLAVKIPADCNPNAAFVKW